MRDPTTTITPVPGAVPRHDDEGREIVKLATCGYCGRTWNDAAISSVTPVPAGRCPFECDHDYKEPRPLRDYVVTVEVAGCSAGWACKAEGPVHALEQFANAHAMEDEEGEPERELRLWVGLSED